MGRIAHLQARYKASGGKFPGQTSGEAAWQRTFSNVSTDKERAYRQPNVITASTSGRSMVGSDVATKRLVAALRSKAPGGWSDDRWEQAARQFTGVAYV